MNTNDAYEKWKHHKSDQVISNDFSARIMEKIMVEVQPELIVSNNLLIETTLNVKKYLERLVAIGMSAIGIYRAAYHVVMLLTP